MSAAACFEYEPFDQVPITLLVVDARIAVAREHVRGSERPSDVERLLAALCDVRVQLDDLLGWIPRLGQQSPALAASARASVNLVCDWCAEVSGFLRDLASADSYGTWMATRRRAADQSCVYVRDYLSPAFDVLDRACAVEAPARAAALRLYGAVVDLNWQIGS